MHGRVTEINFPFIIPLSSHASISWMHFDPVTLSFLFFKYFLLILWKQNQISQFYLDISFKIRIPNTHYEQPRHSNFIKFAAKPRRFWTQALFYSPDTSVFSAAVL